MKHRWPEVVAILAIVLAFTVLLVISARGQEVAAGEGVLVAGWLACSFDEDPEEVAGDVIEHRELKRAAEAATDSDADEWEELGEFFDDVLGDECLLTPPGLSVEWRAYGDSALSLRVARGTRGSKDPLPWYLVASESID